jgi:hypothetical protein
MSDTPKYDSGKPHVVLPVVHAGTNEVHDIAIPESTPLAEVHNALLDAGYGQPTAEGAVENSEDFKAKARQAWEKTSNGQGQEEAGFWTGATGKSVEIPGVTQDESGHGHQSQTAAPSALGLAHVHNNHLQEDPSRNDIEQAKKSHKTIWVVSRGGLYSVGPSGEVTHIYSNPDWMKQKK